MSNRIRQDDVVEVVSGDDRGLRGAVQRISRGKGRVVVSGVNIVKKHQKPARAGRSQVQPGIIDLEARLIHCFFF